MIPDALRQKLEPPENLNCAISAEKLNAFYETDKFDSTLKLSIAEATNCEITDIADFWYANLEVSDHVMI